MSSKIKCTRCRSVAHNVAHCPYPEKLGDRITELADHAARMDELNELVLGVDLDELGGIGKYVKFRRAELERRKPSHPKLLDTVSSSGEHRSMDTNKVTRFEVIDHTAGGEGRAYVKHDVSVELSYQDDGRTLKVFVGDRKDGDA